MQCQNLSVHIAEQLFLLDQPAERFNQQLFAVVHVVKYLSSENKVSAINPDIGVSYEIDFFDTVLFPH